MCSLQDDSIADSIFDHDIFEHLPIGNIRLFF